MNANILLPLQTLETEEECDELLAATLDLEEAAHQLDLETWIAALLHHPERELTARFPLHREDNESELLNGFRVQHVRNGGATLGPVSLSPHASLHEAKAAAMEMTWQLSLLDYPFGGAAGAVACDPEQMSERDLRKAARSYGQALEGVIGPFRDVLTPGDGCNEQTMAWVLERGEAGDPRHLGAVTGKPEALWGLADYSRAAAYGIVGLLNRILHDVRGCRWSLQGFGRRGSSVARELTDAGMALTAVADVSGGVASEGGIDTVALAEHVGHAGVVFGYAAAEAVCNADVLEADCDVLVLAAAPRQVTRTNADRVRARVVIEAVQGAVTRNAEEMLVARGIVVVPYILASAGTTVAACTEWSHNVQVGSVAPDLRPTVALRVDRAFDLVDAAARQHGLSLRRAAVLAAVERVAARLRI